MAPKITNASPAEMQDAFYYAVHATPDHAYFGYDSPFTGNYFGAERITRKLSRGEALERSLVAASRAGYDGPRFSDESSIQRRATQLVAAYLEWGRKHDIDVPAGEWSGERLAAEKTRIERERESIPGKLERLEFLVTVIATRSIEDRHTQLTYFVVYEDAFRTVLRALKGDRPAFPHEDPQQVRRAIGDVLAASREALDYLTTHAAPPAPARLPASREKTLDDLVEVIAALERLEA